MTSTRSWLVVGLFVALACGSPTPTSSPGDSAASDRGAQPAVAPKPYPRGVFPASGIVRNSLEDVVSRTRLGSSGLLLAVPWNLCDTPCLLDTIKLNLEAARKLGKKLSLTVADGVSAPADVKARCQLFGFEFRGEAETMCVAWDENYLAAKKALVTELGQRFDRDEALAYVYFTGPCSTNGNEGHCRIDEAAYRAAGYTPDRMNAAYDRIMDAYLQAFPRTPLVFEVHTLFSSHSAALWEHQWQRVAGTGRVGIAAWWCSERLSLAGAETVPVWPLVQSAARETFAVCQTVASFTKEPYRFSDLSLGLNYGAENGFDASDSARAFTETMDWIEGKAAHAGQPAPISRFSVLETWDEDVKNPAFQARLGAF